MKHYSEKISHLTISAFRKTGTERHPKLPIYGLFLVSMMPGRTAQCKVCFSEENIFVKVMWIFK